MKHCRSCLQTKSFGEFYKRARIAKYPDSYAGYSDKCKDCVKAQQTLYVKSNPERKHTQDRASNLRNEYGLTLQDWDDLFAKQKGCCAICERHQSTVKKVLAVDHCHKTGKVRGLLCTACNLMLGYSQDSIELFTKASDYLIKTNSELAETSNVVVLESLGK